MPWYFWTHGDQESNDHRRVGAREKAKSHEQHRNPKDKNGQKRPRDRTVDLLDHERARLADGSAYFERPFLNEVLCFRIGREFCYAAVEAGSPGMADRRCAAPHAVLRPDFVNRHRNGCTKPVARFVCLRPILRQNAVELDDGRGNLL